MRNLVESVGHRKRGNAVNKREKKEEREKKKVEENLKDTVRI